jgi:hypothetical protein
MKFIKIPKYNGIVEMTSIYILKRGDILKSDLFKIKKGKEKPGINKCSAKL